MLKVIRCFVFVVLCAFVLSGTVHAYTGQQASTLFRVRLWENGDPANAITLTGTTKGTHEFTQATVRVDIYNDTDSDAEDTIWRIKVTPKGNWGVYEVQFPIFKLTPYTGGNRLLVPHGSGVQLDDPFNMTNTTQGSVPRRHTSCIWYGIYPSISQTMQLIMHDNGDNAGEGIIYWTKDSTQFVKEFIVKKISATELNLIISHFPVNAGKVGATWGNHYEIRTTKFSEGWWKALYYDYKPWALEQKWANAGTILDRITASGIPAWFKKNAVLMTAASPTMSYNEGLITDIRSMLPETEIAVWLTQWMKYSFDEHYPDYFPPADENGYQDVIALEDDTTKRVHIFPYMNAILAESGYYTNLSNAKTTGPTASSWNWNYGADWTQYGDYSLTYSGCIYKIMRNNSVWKDDFTTLVHKNFNDYGVDGHYLDQLTRNSIFLPFNEDTSGNHQAFGRYWADNLRDFVKSVRRDNSYNDKVLMGEGFSEAVVNVVQIGYGIQPSYYDHKLIPMFETVYHAYHSIAGWEIYPPALNDNENFAAALAGGIHFGRKVGGFGTMETFDELYKAGATDQNQLFLKRTVEVLLKNIETCLYGYKMRDPEVLGINNHSITYYHDKNGSESSVHSLPEVRASLWKSATGKLVILLSNESATTKYPIVRTSLISSGTTLYKHTGGSITYSKTIGIAVPPFSWLALSTNPY